MKISIPTSNNIPKNNKTNLLSAYSLQNEEYPSLSYVSNNKVYNYISEKKDNVEDYAKGKLDTADAKIKDLKKKSKWAVGNFGNEIAGMSYAISKIAEEKATYKAKKWGLGNNV